MLRVVQHGAARTRAGVSTIHRPSPRRKEGERREQAASYTKARFKNRSAVYSVPDIRELAKLLRVDIITILIALSKGLENNSLKITRIILNSH